ncbi:hypothetical protein LINGRAHAP2_LOCUS22363 [Linum grandiflorum]
MWRFLSMSRLVALRVTAGAVQCGRLCSASAGLC